MKFQNLLRTALAFCCWNLMTDAAATARAEDPVTVSVALPQEGFQLFAPLVLPPVGATGVMDSVAGSHITDLEGAFTTAFPPTQSDFPFPHQPLALTVVDGPDAGTLLLITQFSETVLTADRDLTGLELSGAAYELRRAWTMNSLRGAASALRTGSPVLADIFWIWDDSIDGYTRLFYSSGGLVGFGWRAIGRGSADYSNFPIHPARGLFFQRQWAPTVTAPTLNFTGFPPTHSLRVPLKLGFNPVSRGTMAPLTLGQSRLQERLGPLGGENPGNFLIWIQQADGTYTRYWFSAGGLFGVGWRRIGGGSNDASDTPLPPAFLIELRWPPSATVILPPPPH